MRRGDIVIVAPPGEFGKPRPALVIQADATLHKPMITYVPFTSDLLRVPDVRVSIAPNMENNLRVPSEVVVDMIQTSSLSRFGAVIGRIDGETMRLVETALMLHLGLI